MPSLLNLDQVAWPTHGEARTRNLEHRAAMANTISWVRSSGGDTLKFYEIEVLKASCPRQRR